MSRTIRRLALLVTLLLVVMGAVGASAIDGRAATNKLTGCRNTSTGTLDQVKAGLLPIGGACGAREVAVTWNKTGPRGPQGPTGATGATGAPGVSGREVVSAQSPMNSDELKTVTAYCPAGKVAVGGGHGTAWPTYIVWSAPTLGGWMVQARELPPGTATDWSVMAYAICVTALP